MNGLVLRGARIAGWDCEVDLEIRGGAVRGIGPAGTLVVRGADERRLDGRFVVPGLWDEHVHFSQWAMTAPRLDVSAATSAAEVVSAVARRLADDTVADPLIGFGFRDGLWPDRPTSSLLDAVSSGRSVVLVSGDLHCAWANSAALARYGFTERDDVLREDDAFRLVGLLGALTDSALDELVGTAAERAARRGVVGVVDLEMRWNVGDWPRRVASGVRSLRVETGVYRPDLDRAVAAGLRSGDEIPGGEGLIRMGPLKVLIDGSLNTRTAYCDHAYDGVSGEHDHGVLTVPQDELDPLLDRAVAAGIRPTVHAIGDAAIRIALDALGRVGGGRIEHAQLVADADLPRFAELGVVAGVQPEHAVDDRDVADRYWAGRTGRVVPLRSLLDAGARLALGSDAPVAPLDPWVAIAAAVGRTRDGAPPWHPEQRITVAEALAASTRAGIAPVRGARADLAVLELDPFAADPEELRGMPVAATLLGGRFTHDAL